MEVKIINLSTNPGQGRGAGLPARGEGGANKCVCPKCGDSVSHERGTPCNELTCPKCGVQMIGR